MICNGVARMERIVKEGRRGEGGGRKERRMRERSEEIDRSIRGMEEGDE